ncbi:hypothetical protein F5146DRAFT_1116814 [Armillaria mellea]|nr:hypothetical protein F5146DRAFT_1116814 [Armillaria mellea]
MFEPANREADFIRELWNPELDNSASLTEKGITKSKPFKVSFYTRYTPSLSPTAILALGSIRVKRSILVSPLKLEQDMKEDPGQDVPPLPTVGQETTFRPVWQRSTRTNWADTSGCHHIVTLVRTVYRRKMVPSVLIRSGEHGLRSGHGEHEGIVTGAGTHVGIVFSALPPLWGCRGMVPSLAVNTRLEGLGLLNGDPHHAVNTYRNEALDVVNLSTKYDTYCGYPSSKMRRSLTKQYLRNVCDIKWFVDSILASELAEVIDTRITSLMVVQTRAINVMSPPPTDPARVDDEISLYRLTPSSHSASSIPVAHEPSKVLYRERRTTLARNLMREPLGSSYMKQAHCDAGTPSKEEVTACRLKCRVNR